MISDQEFLEVIQGLHEKTVNENLKWEYEPPKVCVGYSGTNPQQTAGGYGTALSGPQPSDIFWVRLPKSVVELQYGSPTAEPDYITFAVARRLGEQPLAFRKVYEGDFGWEPLSNLYALVKRRELGWDDVFSSMREFLERPKKASN